MEDTAHRAIAIVGLGAILPDACDVAAFWNNVKNGRYSIRDVEPQRWDPKRYYDPDPAAPDKTYSKIGGWVREYEWDPIHWHLPVPPRVVNGMDEAQKWGIACTRQALNDYGFPKRALNLERTAVILGNAMAGEKHYLTSMRVHFPEYEHELEEIPSFAALPEALRRDITRELHARIARDFPDVTEDTMPGELANCIAGRIANLFNLHGPNFVVDAACASAMAAISASVEGLIQREFDVAITGGIDRNMGAPTFVKFCKIGALSATGTRPYAEGADGFVMGEGAGILLLKRLADAERDQDKIYAVIRGVAGASDGKGKGITAPNPEGQKICVQRAWQNAGLSPATAGLIEGHGTSTRVGDVVEVQSISQILNDEKVSPRSVALGSVKSNIGHLKGAAGAAGLLKTTLALHEKVLPPSIHCEHPNPDIDFAHSPLFVNTELREWNCAPNEVRRAGVSAFGFGGTNFHVVLEEYIPHRLNGGNSKRSIAIGNFLSTNVSEGIMNTSRTSPVSASCKLPLRGALVIGASSAEQLAERLRAIYKRVLQGDVPAPAAPANADLRATERIAIDYADAKDLADKLERVLKALASDQATLWKALRAQGVFRGHGAAPKVAFLYTGQGSQYVNMLRPLHAMEPIVRATFEQADRVMTPLLGKPLTNFIFVDEADREAVEKAEEDLRQTAITQPAVLATDIALTRLLAAYGIEPDMTMGHSLGEYGALIAAGALSFEEALEAVSARGKEMTRVSVEDKGLMAAVFAPIAEIERILKSVDGYVVIANINSDHQAVIGGASKPVLAAMGALQKAGFDVTQIPVSHAFHTSIVAPASVPLREMLQRLHLQTPKIPIVANVDAEFYPAGDRVVPQMVDILSRQVASPVQFVKGLHTLYKAGARIFVECGPKKALQGFAEDVLGSNGEVVSLFTNHPKFGDVVSFNQALCGLYAAGLGRGEDRPQAVVETATSAPAKTPQAVKIETRVRMNGNRYEELGRIFAEAIDRGRKVFQEEEKPRAQEPVAITGAALGLPGTDHIFDDGNIGRILNGEQFIDVIPSRLRREMLDKHITRLVKSEEGGPTFESISDVADVIKLAGRGKNFDLNAEFGIPAERVAALDRTTQLAIAAGLDALRDAGIPLVMRYKTTSKGTQLPDRWGLPDSMRDETGVIFASVYPGYNSLADEITRYHKDLARREQLQALESLRDRAQRLLTDANLINELERRISDLKTTLEKEPYSFDRRFLLRTLSMGHSQFAELIGARGPNAQVNAACASTAEALAVAEDWIHTGRCRRVVIVSADDITSNALIDWFGAGFLASGAAATDEIVEDAATPFDRRRHGMIIGMGAAAIVIESADAARERSIRPICEVLSAVTANSAFHGTRLDVDHISKVMEVVVAKAESRAGIKRQEIAPQTVFVSHETYTPARGGSASAEINALRHVFGSAADQVVIANTKGFTGHAMGTGIEEIVAIKALETGVVPPVPNFKEVDPELGVLNLSRGGAYPVEYALRLGAGFGSQIGIALLRRVEPKDGKRHHASELGYETRIEDRENWGAWLASVAGTAAAELEVVNRTLRVKNGRVPAISAESKQDVQTKRAEEKSKQRVPAPIPSSAPPAIPTMKVKVEATPQSTAPITIKKEVARSNEAEAAPQVATLSKIDEVSVKDRVLALVAEKTGYPVDMLDLDLDLEADLGVDTVKQAEVFASVRQMYGIVRDEKLKLRDFPTLAHVIQFVNDRRTDLPSGVSKVAVAEEKLAPTATSKEVKDAAPVKSTSAGPQSAGADDVKTRILELVVEKTGYPVDMLDPELDLEADLGVDTVKQAEMFAAIRSIYNIPRDATLKLRDFPTLNHVIQFVYDRRPDLASAVAAPATPVAAAAETSTTKEEPETATAAESSSIHNTDEIRKKVLEIASEKTGYPTDMLDLELDLEADLGIDTVKQAEMMAAIRGAYGIARNPNLKLRDFPTLGHIIKFAETAVRSQTPASAIQDVEQPAAPTSQEESTPTSNVLSFDAANRVPRRVPVAMVRPPLSACKSTEVSLSAGSRVVIATDRGGVADALTQKLQARGVEVLRVDASRAEELTEAIKAFTSSAGVHGLYWLPALDQEPDIRSMDAMVWRESVRVRAKSLFATARALYEQLGSSGTFLISATRMGGQHGYGEGGALAPLGGAVTGFTKTFKRERSEALVKAVDFEAAGKAEQIANLLIDETLRDPGAVEIGYKDAQRWTVGLCEVPAAAEGSLMTLTKDTVFVITGAAGSIVSAITCDLAAASRGTFYLLDLVPEPKADDPDLKRFASDRDGLKRELFARMQAKGERATPALIEKELAALERANAALNAIEAVKKAGGKVQYFSVNLTDAAAVERVIAQIRERSGRVDVLVHAAGLERSHMLPDKDPRQFDLVFDVKADGFFNLLHAIGNMPLAATVVFSSIAGRFGNAGQADYSAANDLLCKITSSLRRTSPSTRAIAIDWTAWGGIGMATRGSIPKMMELAGIDMLSPDAGVPMVRRELTCGNEAGEVVIADRLGVLLQEFDETGGLDESEGTRIAAEVPVLTRVVATTLYGGLSAEATLDPKAQPFLYDHQIDGTPVLPGVMGIEAFAEAAKALLPDWDLRSVENVSFLAPVKFYRKEPRTLNVNATVYASGRETVADCQLCGTRTLVGHSDPQHTVHFTGRVRLSKDKISTPMVNDAIPKTGTVIPANEIYQVYFHGPAYQVIDKAWMNDKGLVARMSQSLPPNHSPADRVTAISPRLIELCFQAAGLWEIRKHGRFGLPHEVARITFWDQPSNSDEVYAVVDAKPDGSFNVEVTNETGRCCLRVEHYVTVALPVPVETSRAEVMHAAA